MKNIFKEAGYYKLLTHSSLTLISSMNAFNGFRAEIDTDYSLCHAISGVRDHLSFTKKSADRQVATEYKALLVS
jgi:hypothetical protein